MAYNWAREEEWRQWKDAEEKKLRELGVSEEFIASLRAFDWDMFNDDRRFYDHHQETGSYLETLVAAEDQKEIRTVSDLMDEIDNPELFKILAQCSQDTLQILVLKMNGLSANEIAVQVNLTPKAVFRRLDRLKKKIKKIL